MPRRRALFDFGFDPVESPYHFVVETGETTTLIAERYAWPPEGDDTAGQPASARQPALKVALSRYRWGRVAEAAADVFNRRLRAAGFRPAAWKPGETLLAPYFGKELTLLLWAIEDADATVIPNMLANWLGLAPEERWWLYTTINATAGHPEYGKDKGWRKAIKISFAENPAALPPSSLLNGDAALREPRDPYRVLPPAPPP
ncbi:MAG TPA: DUF3780 domain-containing protein, partial [Chloroflexota bacterium]|nr:DUF3780 domain-containing protein [Chloroflexota bacterium]